MTLTCDNCKLPCNSKYRVNETGVKGIFWCKSCMDSTKKEIDEEILELSEIIAGDRL